MTSAQQGDAAAYEALLTLLAREARAFIARRVSFADWGEDVVQEVLLTVHRSLRTYDPQRPFGPWFYAIVNNRLIDALRARRRLNAREIVDDEVVAAHAVDDRPNLGGHMQDRLAHAVACLPRVQREVVSLLKYEDLSVRDVAARLGMTEAAVKATAHRGYKVLRRMVGVPSEYRPAH